MPAGSSSPSSAVGQHLDPGRSSSVRSSTASSTRASCRCSIKQLEADGLAFEGAEASFELLIRRHGRDYVAPFRIVDYTCLIEQRDGQELLAEATVKVEVDGEILHTAADGNGPVNALDAALRKALRAFYPSSTRSTWSTTRCASSTAVLRPPPGHASSSTRWMARGPGRPWAATRTSSRPRPRPSPIRSNTRSGSPGTGVRRRDERHFTTELAAESSADGPRPAGSSPRPTARPRPHGGNPLPMPGTPTPPSTSAAGP